MVDKNILRKAGKHAWEIPADYKKGMRVPGRVFASERMLESILGDDSLDQMANVATLPGIWKYSLVMPDAHEGYGAPVGEVAAFLKEDGIISPGMVGFDINCGVRVLKSDKTHEDIKDNISNLTNSFYEEVPSGVGRGGSLNLSIKELNSVLAEGVGYMLDKGYATENDGENCESKGILEGADPNLVSNKAKQRGRDQLGTIGAGNHFVEIQRVDEIFDKKTAEELGVFKGQVCVMIHCGSRGFGHQVATDYIKIMLNSLDKYGISLVDRQLSCAPFSSEEGRDYFRAMASAANFAWANRQLITYEVRRAWDKVFGGQDSENLKLIYDVAHNIAKIEKYEGKELVVHRKGATRAFPGQPVLIPGSMGTSSYILLGKENSLRESFGSCCHGAGRVMSRTKAKKIVYGEDLKKNLEKQGISVRAGSMAGLAEEAPLAYKDVEEVVDVVYEIGLAGKVARLKPIGVIKG